MSLASKVALGLACGFTACVVYYVQVKQQEDIKRMHEGVVRDKERQQKRKAENTLLLQQQSDLTRALKKQNRDEEVVLKLLEDAKESGN